MKKKIVLAVLFILPVVVYLFFASGVNNFGRLPILTENVVDVARMDSDVQLKDKITILGFLGNDVASKQGNAFNLNQKIYKRFGEFNDFQMVMVVTEDQRDQVEELKSELGKLADIDKWHFAFGSKNEIRTIFESLGANVNLDDKYSTPNVFIVDKDLKLRGRTDDEDEGIKYGFDTSSVAELNNKMVDDIKIILAEYRLALKKNNADRSK
jgi:cytochrome oxidase Cu insertion factor (SCO1/SenC/PrrC family)